MSIRWAPLALAAAVALVPVCAGAVDQNPFIPPQPVDRRGDEERIRAIVEQMVPVIEERVERRVTDRISASQPAAAQPGTPQGDPNGLPPGLAPGAPDPAAAPGKPAAPEDKEPPGPDLSRAKLIACIRGKPLYRDEGAGAAPAAPTAPVAGESSGPDAPGQTGGISSGNGTQGRIFYATPSNPRNNPCSE